MIMDFQKLNSDSESESDSSDDGINLPPELSSEENQKARSYLRERFLRAVSGIVGMCLFVYLM